MINYTLTFFSLYSYEFVMFIQLKFTIYLIFCTEISLPVICRLELFLLLCVCTVSWARSWNTSLAGMFSPSEGRFFKSATYTPKATVPSGLMQGGQQGWRPLQVWLTFTAVFYWYVCVCVCVSTSRDCVWVIIIHNQS